MQDQGYKVSLTRYDDRYLALDERTKITNSLHADLFISLHVNAVTDKKASGIETFCLEPYLFENISNHRVTDPHGYEAQRTKLYAQSKAAAQAIHTNLFRSAQSYTKEVIDRHVQYKVPQVLYGIFIPAVLIELGFLSHAQEGKLLKNSVYQQKIVEGITQGIDSFFASLA